MCASVHYYNLTRYSTIVILIIYYITLFIIVH